MRLTVDIDEMVDLLKDERKYGEDCGHRGFDPGCNVCQSKRVIQAHEEGELEISGEMDELLTVNKNN